MPNLSQTQIQTQRLTLTPVNATYRQDIFTEFTPEITTYMTPAPAKDISETDAFIVDAQAKLAKGTDLQMVVLDKESKEFLGVTGAHRLDTMHPHLGIWIKKAAHGSRFGREAVTAMKQWIDAHVDYEYIVYPVADVNIASRKIAESLGGVVAREYDEVGQAGNAYRAVEYRMRRGVEKL